MNGYNQPVKTVLRLIKRLKKKKLRSIKSEVQKKEDLADKPTCKNYWRSNSNFKNKMNVYKIKRRRLFLTRSQHEKGQPV
jgi:hypothetical protein